MTSVDGYNASHLESKEDATMTGASIVGDDLVFIRKDGTTKNVGSVRGDKGPDGPDGTLTQADLANGQGGLLYTPWFAMTLAAGWIPFASGNWVAPQYRYNDYYLEIRGLVQYTGSTVTSGYPVVATGLAVSPINRHVVLGSLHSRDVGDIRVMNNGTILVYVSGLLDPLESGDWLAFNNIRVPLD